MLALDAVLAADAGWSLDLTPGVVARALTHTDNAYWIPHFPPSAMPAAPTSSRILHSAASAVRRVWVVMEDALDRIAAHLKRDADDVRTLNFYAEGQETPFGQAVDDNLLPRVWAEVKRDAEIDRPPRRDNRLQQDESGAEARARSLPAEVRHLLQHPAHEPGGRAGACLQRRLDSPQPRRHRDGAGAVHQGGAGRGRSLQRSISVASGPAPPRPPRCPTPRRRRRRPARTSTAGRPSRRPTPSSSA